MTDTVDTAASLSPADGAEKPQDAAPADESKEPQDAPSRLLEDDADRQEEAETQDEARSGPPKDDDERREEEAEGQDDARSVTELLEQLGRELRELAMSGAQLEAARNMPEVRRAARDIVGTLVVVVAALSAFAFINVAAVVGLSRVLTTWLSALVLAAVWIAVGGVLLFGLMGRARRWLMWIVLKAPPTRALEELERERNDAGKAARTTLERLGPAIAVQIALAAVPNAGEVAGDVASGTVEVAGTVIETSDEIVEELVEELPGGGAVNQVWDVALAPGRFGIRVATTVLRRSRPAD